jgi:hypothetical protein
MGKTKGFYLDFSPPPYPDEKEAEKNIASIQEIETIKQHFKPVDRTTGLTYAQIVSKNLPSIIEEKESVTENDIQLFRQKNPWVVINQNVLQEINPLEKNDEDFVMPSVETLFNKN